MCSLTIECVLSLHECRDASGSLGLELFFAALAVLALAPLAAVGADGGAPAVLALLVCSGPDIKGDRGGGDSIQYCMCFLVLHVLLTFCFTAHS